MSASATDSRDDDRASSSDGAQSLVLHEALCLYGIHLHMQWSTVLCTMHTFEEQPSRMLRGVKRRPGQGGAQLHVLQVVARPVSDTAARQVATAEQRGPGGALPKHLRDSPPCSGLRAADRDAECCAGAARACEGTHQTRRLSVPCLRSSHHRHLRPVHSAVCGASYQNAAPCFCPPCTLSCMSSEGASPIRKVQRGVSCTTDVRGEVRTYRQHQDACPRIRGPVRAARGADSRPYNSAALTAGTPTVVRDVNALLRF